MRTVRDAINALLTPGPTPWRPLQRDVLGICFVGIATLAATPIGLGMWSYLFLPWLLLYKYVLYLGVCIAVWDSICCAGSILDMPRASSDRGHRIAGAIPPRPHFKRALVLLLLNGGLAVLFHNLLDF